MLLNWLDTVNKNKNKNKTENGVGLFTFSHFNHPFGVLRINCGLTFGDAHIAEDICRSHLYFLYCAWVLYGWYLPLNMMMPNMDAISFKSFPDYKQYDPSCPYENTWVLYDSSILTIVAGLRNLQQEVLLPHNHVCPAISINPLESS